MKEPIDPENLSDLTATGSRRRSSSSRSKPARIKQFPVAKETAERLLGRKGAKPAVTAITAAAAPDRVAQERRSTTSEEKNASAPEGRRKSAGASELKGQAAANRIKAKSTIKSKAPTKTKEPEAPPPRMLSPEKKGSSGAASGIAARGKKSAQRQASRKVARPQQPSGIALSSSSSSTSSSSSSAKRIMPDAHLAKKCAATKRTFRVPAASAAKGGAGGRGGVLSGGADSFPAAAIERFIQEGLAITDAVKLETVAADIQREVEARRRNDSPGVEVIEFYRDAVNVWIIDRIEKGVVAYKKNRSDKQFYACTFSRIRHQNWLIKSGGKWKFLK